MAVETLEPASKMEVEYMEEGPINPFSREIYSPIVRITIGRCDHVYTVHHKQLVESSEYFRGCLGLNPGDSHTKEGRSMTVHIDIDENYYDSFESFILFVYCGKFHTTGKDDILLDQNTVFPVPMNTAEENTLRVRCSRSMVKIAKLYVLGERLLCDELKGECIAAVKRILSVARKYPFRDHLQAQELISGPFDLHERRDYRRWCEQHQAPVSFKSPKFTTLFHADDLLETIHIVLENTTPRKRPDPKGEYNNKDLRGLMVAYCATFAKVLHQNSENFRIFFNENRDFNEELSTRVFYSLPEQAWLEDGRMHRLARRKPGI